VTTTEKLQSVEDGLFNVLNAVLSLEQRVIALECDNTIKATLGSIDAKYSVDQSKIPSCAACKGSGNVKQMWMRWKEGKCNQCEGTGRIRHAH